MGVGAGLTVAVVEKVTDAVGAGDAVWLIDNVVVGGTDAVRDTVYVRVSRSIIDIACSPTINKRCDAPHTHTPDTRLSSAFIGFAFELHEVLPMRPMTVTTCVVSGTTSRTCAVCSQKKAPVPDGTKAIPITVPTRALVPKPSTSPAVPLPAIVVTLVERTLIFRMRRLPASPTRPIPPSDTVKPTGVLKRARVPTPLSANPAAAPESPAMVVTSVDVRRRIVLLPLSVMKA